uniref:F-box domain-containing protein n=1 Tax=Globodera pallida TaxID=36090 RepID=A0A183CM27_GLOPA
MSDNKSDEEQQQQMEKIFICADVLLGIFDFLCPFDVGLKMALISDRLDRLVDVHFKLRKWSLGQLQIRRETNGNGAQIINARSGERHSEIRRETNGNGAQIINARSGERQSIPEGPIPDNVIGFEQIVISYVDQAVVEFLQRIRRLFDSSGTNVAFYTSDNQTRSWEIIWQKIWPLVGDNICGFFLHVSVLPRLRQFSPEILRNCANLGSIYSSGLFPEFPAEDNADASPDQAVAKWLITPREDGLPKMLYCDFCSPEMDELKWSFVNASESANFIIKFLEDEAFVPFELKNNWTGERLTLRQIDEDKWLLVRCPIAREEDKWANWEKEAIKWKWTRQWNYIFITFKDRDIGDGLHENQDD